jgi:ComF family protein
MFVLIRWFQNGKQWFWDSVFPPRCVLCRKEGLFLCDNHALPKGGHPSFQPQNMSEIFFATAYGDPAVKKLISHFKFRGNAELGKYFAKTIQKNIPVEILQNALIVPIPLHWTRRIWRGFNQAEVLAQYLKELFPNIEITNHLKRIQKTKQQAKLSREKRAGNLQSAFSWTGNPLRSETRPIILLDDVVTSGSTLEAAAKVLQNSGTHKIYGITFAGGGKDK